VIGGCGQLCPRFLRLGPVAGQCSSVDLPVFPHCLGPTYLKGALEQDVGSLPVGVDAGQ
jgi:hypothetical protein